LIAGWWAAVEARVRDPELVTAFHTAAAMDTRLEAKLLRLGG